MPLGKSPLLQPLSFSFCQLKIRCGPPVAERCSRVTIGSCSRGDRLPLRNAVGMILRSSMSRHHTPDASPIGMPIRYSCPVHEARMTSGSHVAFLNDPVPGIGLPLASLSRFGTGVLLLVSGKTGSRARRDQCWVEHPAGLLVSGDRRRATASRKLLRPAQTTDSLTTLLKNSGSPECL